MNRRLPTRRVLPLLALLLAVGASPGGAVEPPVQFPGSAKELPSADGPADSTGLLVLARCASPGEHRLRPHSPRSPVLAELGTRDCGLDASEEVAWRPPRAGGSPAASFTGTAVRAVHRLGSGATGPPQEAARRLAKGDRIRIWAAVAGFYGEDVRFLGRRGDTLRIRGEGGVHRVSVGQINRIQLRHRTGSRWKRGALIGGAVGAVATTSFLLGFCGDADTLCDGDEEARAIGIIGIPPVLVGAVVGRLIGRYEWVEVDLEQSRTSALLPGAQGSRIGIAFRVPVR